MFKRTKGYFLLTMLVLTGLAGRIHSNILTTRERHTLSTELKTSKNDFLKTVEGLSPRQFNFKTDKNQLSVKECVYQLISIENNLWTAAKASLMQETLLLQKTIAGDEALYSFPQRHKTFQCKIIRFKNSKEALKFFKTQRSEMLKYVHTSTANVRAHIAETSVGNMDAYQLMLLSTIYSEHYTQLIEKIKAHPNFPE